MAKGTSHTYVPDFIVWRTTGEVEIHEVIRTSRQEKVSLQEREKAARKICQQRGWSYVVHTEETLPQSRLHKPGTDCRMHAHTDNDDDLLYSWMELWLSPPQHAPASLPPGKPCRKVTLLSMLFS